MIKSLLFLFGLMNMTIAARLDFNSPACNIFLQKFGTALANNGTGATHLAFTGNVDYLNNSANLQVTLQYSDNTYFNNATYYGLVQEDGHAQEETCLDLKLYKYGSSSFTGETQVTDLKISNSSNFQKKWRQYQFVINGTDLENRLIKTSNSNQYIYTGYYAIKYFAAGTSQLQYTFFFSFSVTVSKTTSASVDTVFNPINYYEAIACSSASTNNCSVSTSTSLQFCSDFTCSTIINAPTLYLNDQFVLKQTITTSGLNSFYLSNAVITYTGNGLNKVAKIVQYDYSHAGYAIYLLNAEIAWSQLTIQVQASTTTVQGTSGSTRLLEQRILEDNTVTNSTPVTGKTETITCIKFSRNDDTCPTCSQQCQAFGYAENTCSECSALTSDSNSTDTSSSNDTNKSSSSTATKLTLAIMLGLNLII